MVTAIDCKGTVLRVEDINFACAWGAYDYIQVKVELHKGEMERFNTIAHENDWRWHNGNPIVSTRNIATINLTRGSKIPSVGDEITFRTNYDPTPQESSMDRAGTMDDDAISCCLV